MGIEPMNHATTFALADLVEYLNLTRVVVRKDWTNSDFVLRSEVWEAAADLAQRAFGTSMSSRLPDTGYNGENRHEYSKVPPRVTGHPVLLDSFTEIHPRTFSISNIDIKHSLSYSPMLSLPDRLFAKCLVA